MTFLQEVLGINERNLDWVYRYNPTQHFPLADDKLLTKEVLRRAKIPTPNLLQSCRHYYELDQMRDYLWNRANFVMKPARGSQGGGIVVFDRFASGHWFTTSGVKYSSADICEHAVEILSGIYSLDKTNDAVLIEEKVQLHEFFQKITYQGIPDIRIIVLKQRPIMAMLRIPTRRSDGRANLHAGGIGVSIDLATGLTKRASFKQCQITRHPDSGVNLSGIQLPYWQKILDISQRIQRHVPLLYLGIDFVIDKRYGPQVLELNVRPGLEIQNVNSKGLKGLLLQY